MIQYKKIHIFLRDCSKNRPRQGRPDFFTHEKCLKNLIKQTNWDLATLTVVLDGKYEDEYHLKQHIPKHQVIEIDTKPLQNENRDGSNVSQTLVFEVIKNKIHTIKDDELILVLENDYAFIPFWTEIALDAYTCLDDGKTYLNPYEHLDTFLFVQDRTDHWGMYRNLTSKIKLSNYRHWRTVPMFTSCYLMSKKLFLEDYDYFAKGLADNTTTDALGREKGRVFMTPLHSLACHMQEPFLSPFVDWNRLLNS